MTQNTQAVIATKNTLGSIAAGSNAGSNSNASKGASTTDSAVVPEIQLYQANDNAMLSVF